MDINTVYCIYRLTYTQDTYMTKTIYLSLEPLLHIEERRVENNIDRNHTEAPIAITLNIYLCNVL